jgi:hypothetical protein
VVECGSGGAGTATGAAHAIKKERPLVLLAVPPLWREFFCSISPDVQSTDAHGGHTMYGAGSAGFSPQGGIALQIYPAIAYSLAFVHVN